ncbi:MAG: aldehyde ferredoxin oxidoreductase N-terminal domain-containing protein [Peptoniphilaceae bacterium]|nr:aldehyde ferredoxin oxidoreductase N-terminal domain-containing protein [Peptoniphilaceae bacterium]
MKNSYNILIIDLKKGFLDKLTLDQSKVHMGNLSFGFKFLEKHKILGDFLAIFTSAILNIDNPISKFMVMTRDNGKLSYKSIGGSFGPYLKTNDIDGLVLVNKASYLIDLYIHNDSIKFNKVENLSLNMETYDQLKNIYGKDTSSFYITKAASITPMARLIEDKYSGISHGSANILYKQNIRSLSVKKSNMQRLDKVDFFENNPNRKCPRCPLGCLYPSNSKKTNIFTPSDDFRNNENKILYKLKEDLDEYGIDIFSLSNAIKYAYTNLNDIYNFSNLSPYNLKNICDELLDSPRESYRELLYGREYLESKYGIEKSKRKKSNDNFLIIDSAGLCIFAIDPNNLDNILATINRLSGKSYDKDDASEIINYTKRKLKLI